MGIKFFNYFKIVLLVLFIFISCNLETGEDLIITGQQSETDISKCLKPDPINKDIKNIENFLKAFVNEKKWKILKYLSHDIVWTASGDAATLPSAGTYSGKVEIRSYLRNLFFQINFDDLTIETVKDTDPGFKIETRITGEIKSNRVTFDMEYLFAFQLNSRSKIKSVDIQYETVSMELAFSSGGAGHIVSNISMSPVAQSYSDYFLSLKEVFRNSTYWDSRNAFAEFPVENLPADAIVTPLLIEGLETESISVPDAAADKLIIYMHGGGFCSGDYKAWRQFTYLLAQAAKIPVLTVNYRLAPEDPYPAGLEDCFSIYSEMLKEYEADNVALIGESAGGNLILGTVVKAREMGLPLPGALIPLSCWLDLTNSVSTLISNDATDAFISVEKLNYFRDLYLDDYSVDVTEPLVSPLFGRVDDFPPVYIALGSEECLLGDSISLFNKLIAAQVDVVIELGHGMVHGYPLTSGFDPAIPEAVRTTERIGEFIRNTL